MGVREKLAKIRSEILSLRRLMLLVLRLPQSLIERVDIQQEHLYGLMPTRRCNKVAVKHALFAESTEAKEELRDPPSGFVHRRGRCRVEDHIAAVCVGGVGAATDPR